MIPYFEGRVGSGLDQLGRRTDDEHDVGTLARLKKRPYDYFRMFYADTALFGALPATECGLAFFGSDHVLFGTDMPFDPENHSGHRQHHGIYRRQKENLRGKCAQIIAA